MMVGRLEGRYLEMLTFALSATSVLEIGTFGGYSALSMAAGLAPGGRIVTCEISPVHAAFARRHIAPAPTPTGSRSWRARPSTPSPRCPVPSTWSSSTPTSPPTPPTTRRCCPKLAPRGLIAADNTLWSGRILDPSDTTDDTVALRAFNDFVATDPRVVAVQTTVRDGVTLIRRAD